MSAKGTPNSWEEAVIWLRRQPDRKQLVVDCFYDDPLVGAAQRYWGSEEWQAVRRILADRRGTVLDVGAGRGIASYAFARDGYRPTALEPDSSNLVGAEAIRALARESGLAIQVVQERSEHLPFPDAAFDIVFARAVLHHALDLQLACREFFRVLKPGGILLAIREHVISSPADLPRFLHGHPLHALYGGESALMLKQYLAALRAAGFNRVQTISPWSSPLNYAPRNIESLKDELATLMAGRKTGVRRLIRRCLGYRSVWWLTTALLFLIDNRPGRLYSFVGHR